MDPDEFGIDTEETYRRGAAKLVEMMNARDLHTSSDHGCGAEPLCIGPSGGMDIAMLIQERPGAVATLMLVAIGELCRYRAELGEADQWKRDLLAQLERSSDAHEQEIREMRAQNASLTKVVGELQQQIGERS